MKCDIVLQFLFLYSNLSNNTWKCTSSIADRIVAIILAKREVIVRDKKPKYETQDDKKFGK